MIDKSKVGGYCIYSKNENKSCLAVGRGALTCKNITCPAPDSETFIIPQHSRGEEKPAYAYKTND